MNDKVYLSRDAILGCDDIPREEVEVPEWGGAVLMRGMSAGEREEMVAKNRKPNGEFDSQAAVYYALVIGCEKPKFEESDIAILKQKSAQAVDRLTKAFMRLSGLGDVALVQERGNS